MTPDQLIKGIDISSCQSTVDFNWVAQQNIKFVISKCFQGNDYRDPDFLTNMAGTKAAGMKAACYHYVYPLPTAEGHINRDPVSQAQLHFANSNSELALCDIEFPAFQDWTKWTCSASQIDEWLQQYLETYKSLSSQTLPVYSYPYYFEAVGFGYWLSEYPLWIASYTYSIDNGQIIDPAIPEPWKSAGKSWNFWQDSGGGLMTLNNGIAVDTDCAKDLSFWNC